MKKIEEFWYCVSPQEDLPLYKGASMDEEKSEAIIALIGRYRALCNKGLSHLSIIKQLILDSPTCISDMRILVGVSDKRLYLDLTYIVNVFQDEHGLRLVPEHRECLVKHDTKYFVKHLNIEEDEKAEVLAEQIALYFFKHELIDILNTFASLKTEQLRSIIQKLIAPKELQQMQAKYRGHGAEQAFARIVSECGLDMIPLNKAIDPMGSHDPNVDLSSMRVINRNAKNPNCHSFDLIILAEGEIRVLIQSLIHSSDPGQFGVDKSNETVNIAALVANYNSKSGKRPIIYLLGSVDGVGFCENPSGTIEKMIESFDDFFQMHTLFKIPIFLQKVGMINNIAGISFDAEYFDRPVIEYFEQNYLMPANIANFTGNSPSNLRSISAGKAIVYFKQS